MMSRDFRGKGASIWAVYCLALLIASYVISILTPPFQAPDEFDHVRREYMFGRGQWMLHSSNGSPSGGLVDSGLARYMDQFVPLAAHADRKLASDAADAAASVQWSGQDELATPIGTAYYFPLLYAPQAMGLIAGKTLGLSVEHSYRAARLLALMTAVSLLWWALNIYPPPPLALVVMALPMTVFLAASAALDGIATAVAVLALAAFMRLVVDRDKAPEWLFGILVVSVALVTSCRPNLLPLLALPAFAGLTLRSKRKVVISLIVCFAVFAWTALTIKTTVYPEGPRRVDHASRLIHFALHPQEFLAIVGATLSDPVMTEFYRASFIGILGWLDTPLGAPAYSLFGMSLAGGFVLSLSFRAYKRQPWARLLLLACAIGIVVLTFLALLVQYTAASESIITGIQGRYFIVPVLVLAYAIGGDGTHVRSYAVIGTWFVVCATTFVTFHVTTNALLRRFHSRATEAAQAAPLPGTSVVPSPILTTHQSIELHFDNEVPPKGLLRLSLLFADYGKARSGAASLRLSTVDGSEIKIPFDLRSISDNTYHSFLVDGGRYVRGEIVSEGGEGISVWQTAIGGVPRETCMMRVATDSVAQVTPGCTVP